MVVINYQKCTHCGKYEDDLSDGLCMKCEENFIRQNKYAVDDVYEREADANYREYLRDKALDDEENYMDSIWDDGSQDLDDCYGWTPLGMSSDSDDEDAALEMMFNRPSDEIRSQTDDEVDREDYIRDEIIEGRR